MWHRCCPGHGNVTLRWSRWACGAHHRNHQHHRPQTRGTAIAGGSTFIQRNIVAERILARVERLITGQELTGQVDPDLGY
jgi:hypothetical protein